LSEAPTEEQEAGVVASLGPTCPGIERPQR
jgi:hypothetical protein